MAAETRRIELTPVTITGTLPAPVPESPAVPNLPSESSKSDDAASVRLELVLLESDDLNFPEFYYPQLVFQNTRDTLNMVRDKTSLGTSDQVVEDRQRDEMLALAKMFEDKYGGVPNQRKDRLEDLVDIGYGYDESDSFIDNSEAYDELVPACLTTKHGGFYINVGTLQFRQALDEDRENETDDFEETIKPKKRKLKNGADVKMNKKAKRKEGKENEKENVKNSELADKKLTEKKKKKTNKVLSIDGMLKMFHKEKIQQLEIFNQRGNEAPETTNGEPNGQVADTEESVLSDPLLTLISSTSAGEILQAVNAVDQDFDLDRLLDVDPDTGHPEDSVACKPVKSSCSIPDGLPPTLELSLQELTRELKQMEKGNKLELFASEVNNILINMSDNLKDLSDEVHSRTLSYLASQLSCKKSTLVKRAKKLWLLQLDDQLQDLLQKLRDLVSNVMPEQIDHFNTSCQIFSKARAARLEAEREQKPLDGTDEEEEDKSGKRGPRKRFRWTLEIRELLSDAVKMKMSMFELEVPCSQTLMDRLKSFLEADVKTLWPKGWMQSRILMIESRKVHCHITGVMARKKSISVPKSKKVQDPDMKVHSVKEPRGSLFELLGDDGEAAAASTSINTDVSTKGNLVVMVPVVPSARHPPPDSKREDRKLNISPAKGECATVSGSTSTDPSCGVPDLPTPSLSLQASSFYSKGHQRVLGSTPLHVSPFHGEIYSRESTEQTQIYK